jgi:hypothetical protein
MTVAAANPRFIAEQACYYILQRVMERTRDVEDLDAARLATSASERSPLTGLLAQL